MRHARRWLGLGLACAILLLATLALRGYVTDDTYIHLRYAQHLAERGEFSFNPGQATYGATSPLWIFCLVLLLKLGLAPLVAVWLLGLLSGLCVLWLLDRYLATVTWPPAWKLILLWLAAADAWFLRWSLSGMETPLATAFLLLMLRPLYRVEERTPSWQRYLSWGVTAGLAGLVRPEFVLLGPATLPWLLWRDVREKRITRHGAWRSVTAATAGWLVPLGPWFAYSLQKFGRLVPETATAKSYGLTLAPGAVLSSLARSLNQLAATQGFLWLVLAILIVVVLAWRRKVAAVDASAATPAPSLLKPTDIALVSCVATWCVLLMGGYAVKQVWVISRYLAPLSPPLLLAGASLAFGLLTAGASPTAAGAVAQPATGPAAGSAATVADKPAGSWAPWLSDRRRCWISALLLIGCIATFAWNGWLLLAKVRPHARELSRGIQTCYLGMGEWLRDHSDSDAMVAALDIGAVGYASERQVFDLMGLVSPEILALGREQGFEAMVASGAWLAVTVPDFLVDRTAGQPRWVGEPQHGIQFELLQTCQIAGVGLRESQPWTVALYRLAPVAAEQTPRKFP